jgi:hypothetical protein
LLSAARAAASAGTPAGGFPEICSESKVAKFAAPSVPAKVKPLPAIAGRLVVEVVEVVTLADEDGVGCESGVEFTPPEQAATIAAATANAEMRRSGDTASTRKKKPLCQAPPQLRKR